MSRLTAALAGLLTGLTAVLVVAAPAAAHARLLGSTPKDGSTTTKRVTEIRLRFSQPVRQDPTTVRVTGPDGTAHSEGDPVAVDTTVTQSVSALPTGVIQVGWRTVSMDGHTIEGSFTFTNRAAPPTSSTAATPATSAGAEPTPSSPAASLDARPASDTTGPAESRWMWVLVVVTVLVAAVGGLWWRRRQPRA